MQSLPVAPKRSKTKAISPQPAVSNVPINTTVLSEKMKEWTKRKPNASKKLEQLELTLDNVFSITVSNLWYC